jgi:hypothetical protein
MTDLKILSPIKRNTPIEPKGVFHHYSPPLWYGGTRVPPLYSTAASGEVNIKIYLM